MYINVAATCYICCWRIQKKEIWNRPLIWRHSNQCTVRIWYWCNILVIRAPWTSLIVCNSSWNVNSVLKHIRCMLFCLVFKASLKLSYDFVHKTNNVSSHQWLWVLRMRLQKGIRRESLVWILRQMLRHWSHRLVVTVQLPGLRVFGVVHDVEVAHLVTGGGAWIKYKGGWKFSFGGAAKIQ